MTSLSWLREQRAQGRSDDDIRRALRGKGWKKERSEELLRKSDTAHLFFRPEQAVPFVLGLLGWVIAMLYLLQGDNGAIIVITTLAIVLGVLLSLHTHHFSLGHAWSKRLLFLFASAIAGIGCALLPIIWIVAVMHTLSMVLIICCIGIAFGAGIAFTEYLYTIYCAAAFGETPRKVRRLLVVGAIVAVVCTIVLFTTVYTVERNLAERMARTQESLVKDAGTSNAGRALLDLEGQVNAIEDGKRKGLALDLLTTLRARIATPFPEYSALQLFTDDPRQACEIIDLVTDLSTMTSLIRTEGRDTATLHELFKAPGPYAKLALYQNLQSCVDDASMRQRRIIAQAQL